MLSKKSKSNDNSHKVEQEALKKVETIAELAPNEKTRKEAEKISSKSGALEKLQEGNITLSEDNSTRQPNLK